MIELFDMLQVAPVARVRLLDAVLCPGCGATLMRGQLLVGEAGPARLPHVMCVDCGADASAAPRAA